MRIEENNEAKQAIGILRTKLPAYIERIKKDGMRQDESLLYEHPRVKILIGPVELWVCTLRWPGAYSSPCCSEWGYHFGLGQGAWTWTC